MSSSERTAIVLPREVQVGRRKFLRNAGALGLGVAASFPQEPLLPNPRRNGPRRLNRVRTR